MTLSQFKKTAKENKVNVYKITRIKNSGNNGFSFLYSNQLSENSVSEQLTKEYWNVDLETIYNQWFQN
jgi:hypothetical protein